MNPVATRGSFKILPCPQSRVVLPIDLSFTLEEMAVLKHGLIPIDFDDRWFAFFEDGWLYLHRSWSGLCIFGIRLEQDQHGARVVEAWASGDEDQFRSGGVEEDMGLLRKLLVLLVAGKLGPTSGPTFTITRPNR